jgi:hypothetical protein
MRAAVLNEIKVPKIDPKNIDAAIKQATLSLKSGNKEEAKAQYKCLIDQLKKRKEIIIIGDTSETPRRTGQALANRSTQSLHMAENIENPKIRPLLALAISGLS